MAQITLEIPDAVLPRVIDALCIAGHWSPELGIARGMFAKQEVARMIRERVVSVEQRMAVAAVAAPDEPDIT
jgi:hypothetical protein